MRSIFRQVARPLASSILAMATLLPASAAAQEPPEWNSDRPKLGRGSVKLFDTLTSTYGFEIHAAKFWYRPASGGESVDASEGSFEVGLGQTVTTRAKAFYITGIIETFFRGFDRKSFAWSLMHQSVAAGLALGPIEPEARFGFSLATVDVFHGDWSFEMLSPRVGAGINLHLGKLRIGSHAYSEYFWRWFGPSYRVQGISIDLRLDMGQPKPPPLFRKPGAEGE